MNIKKTTSYVFENDYLQFESFVKNFDDKEFKEFEEVAKKIGLEGKIDDLISGKIVNKSENQAAFHPKYRSYENNQNRPKNIIDAEDQAFKFFSTRWNDCKDNGYKSINIVTLGIGGSFEGPKLLLESLNDPLSNEIPGLDKVIYKFITGSDHKEFEHKTKALEPENTFFIVSSKSFTTDETIENLKRAFAWSGNKKNFIGISANPDEVKKYGIEDIIFFDKEIGGRYSIWSPVTQFHLSGKNRKNFLKGGYQADIDILENQNYYNFIKRVSFTDIFLNNNGKNVRAILSYVWNLRSLPTYFQQLEMESLGKHSSQSSDYINTGQIIFGGYGPRAQHSYFQLLHQGTQEICVDIISTEDDEKSLSYAQAITQSKLLADGESEINLNNKFRVNGNVPVNLFLLKKLDAFSLGYLIAFWEYRTYVTAKMLDINPFDQFGVNAGKIYTNKYLANKD
tara:strand:+ start:168 stop:1526 length:1359 start_codon:yes stop_codon:yes gene_type:complete